MGSDLLRVGRDAPDFALPDQDGNVVRLGDFRGRKNVVLIFYPRDETPGCTKQLCAVRDDFTRFEDQDVVVFGINTQGSASHAKFIGRHELPFQLLVDRDKEVLKAYGCRGPLMTKRTVYGIDKKGVIVLAARGSPSTEEILTKFPHD